MSASDLVAAIGGELELGVAGVGAEDRVFVEQRQRLDLGALLLHGIEEVEHRGRIHLVMRRGAEIKFQAAAMQARRGIVGRDERDLVALADLADGDGDRALIGADDGADLFLRDQALGFGAALLRIGLVVGEDELDLGAAEARQAFALGQRQIEIVVVVDDLGRGLDTPSGHRRRAGRWRRRTDRSRRSPLRACRRAAAIGASAAAAVAPSNTFRREMVMSRSSVDRPLSMKRLKVTVKPQRTASCPKSSLHCHYKARPVACS